MPAGRPSAVARSRAATRQDAGVQRALAHQLRDRPMVDERHAEVEARRASEPVDELRGDGPVEAIPRPLGGDRVDRRAAEQVGREVTGRQERQEQRARRHHGHQHQRRDDSPHHVTRQVPLLSPPSPRLRTCWVGLLSSVFRLLNSQFSIPNSQFCIRLPTSPSAYPGSRGSTAAGARASRPPRACSSPDRCAAPRTGSSAAARR